MRVYIMYVYIYIRDMTLGFIISCNIYKKSGFIIRGRYQLLGTASVDDERDLSV